MSQEMVVFWYESGISWTIHKQSAPHYSRQTTTPTPHHSIFTGRMLFLAPNQQCQSTEGKHYIAYVKRLGSCQACSVHETSALQYYSLSSGFTLALSFLQLRLSQHQLTCHLPYTIISWMNSSSDISLVLLLGCISAVTICRRGLLL